MRPTTCRSCGKKVAFAKDSNGKTQILDLVAPVFGVTTEGDAFTAIRANGEAPAFLVNTVPFKFYVSHFATCPNATSHSKKGAGK